tara:strand:+ start:5288 stop:6793 length:1506 start_codon:yes stop_codon:yes gene_type:complete
MDYSATATETQTSVSPSSDGSNVPDLMRVGTIPDNTAIDVDTDVLDPVIINESFCRFQLQNKGILHSNSKITLSACAVAPVGGDNYFYPPNIGVHALINRATLKVGTKTLCEVEDYGHFQAYQSLFVSGEHNKEREQYTSARIMNHEEFFENPVDRGSYAAGSPIQPMSVGSNNQALIKGVSNGMCLDQWQNGFDDPKPEGNILMKNFQYLTNAPVFQVNLSDLFPFLRTAQLPLYMMTEPVTLEISWTSDYSAATGTQTRACVEKGGTGSIKTPLVNSRIQMMADYIYYPQEIMEQYARQNKALKFAYVDYRLAKRTVDRASAKNLILNVGGAGRIVNKVFSAVQKNVTLGADLITNEYTADAAGATIVIENKTSFNGSLTRNIRYNDHFLYPVDVDNTARHFHNIVQAEGKVPFVVRQEYGAEGLVLGGFLEDYPQDDLTGKFFWTANRLNRNERINSRGIEVYSTYNQLADVSHTYRTYLEMVKVASLRDGRMEVEWA